MNYLVKWPAVKVFSLLVHVGPNEFKYCYTDQPNFTGHIGNLSDFISGASSYTTVIPTTASTIDEARILHPELFI